VDSSRFDPIVWVDETGSTNTDLVESARRGEPEQVLITDYQRAGRARLGRRWESDPGAGLMMSALVRPASSVATWGLISPVLGLSVVDAVNDLVAAATDGSAGIGPPGSGVVAPAALAWPNDVVAPEPDGSGYRKLAGILAEMATNAVVAGVGVNIDLPAGFTTDRNVPIDVTTLLGSPPDRIALAASIVDGLAHRLAAFERSDGAAVVEELNERCWTVGRRVTVTGGLALDGEAVRIEPTGRLVVLDADGVEHVVDAGDVSVR
jgi:BirA family biotin operon repressor/biotin-[acetyl-CoA-carboxylase] ligase